MGAVLREVEVRVLEALPPGQEAVGIEELARRLGLDQSPVAGAVATLAERGLVAVSEESEDEFRAGPKGSGWDGAEFPERRVARALVAAGGEAEIPALAQASGLSTKEVGESLRWLTQRGWAVKDGARLRAGAAWTAGEPALEPDELLLRFLAAHGPARRAAVLAAGEALDAALGRLAQRAGVVDRRERRRRLVAITVDGQALLAGGIESRHEVNELTTELLVSGRWREAEFRAYDVTLPGPAAVPGKEHPFRRILQETRRAFLEMGFEETRSPWVESAFWDFDALFQPQDHPARDMQDTFYVARPEKAALPDPALVDRVRRTHEDGGDTGSIGWRTRWDPALAERCVLRTHTTAATARALYADPKPPRRIFSVGPVFRRETIDYKHLPVFHQVDGIVIDANASFAMLLTLLTTFYRKMGFPRIQFRPAFFPYTEPSVEVFVYLESRQDWVEMGGAGVFRPEVTEPLGCTVPVLAWGLGLERVAMFRFGLSDIREIYLAHLDWLKETPLCRS
ncbi:MAG: phenylalanine--tRNA ligase subunit alpha [Acidobacteria bacterium]|nr:phenylalanine--tRNA ligase subunit alpha [Acidobacteriota bacterium]